MPAAVTAYMRPLTNTQQRHVFRCSFPRSHILPQASAAVDGCRGQMRAKPSALSLALPPSLSHNNGKMPFMLHFFALFLLSRSSFWTSFIALYFSWCLCVLEELNRILCACSGIFFFLYFLERSLSRSRPRDLFLLMDFLAWSVFFCVHATKEGLQIHKHTHTGLCMRVRHLLLFLLFAIATCCWIAGGKEKENRKKPKKKKNVMKVTF